MNIHALIDADITLYKSCSAVEKSIHWGDDQWTLHADAAEAREMFDLAIADIRETTKASKVTLAFSSPSNFRVRLFSSTRPTAKRRASPSATARSSATPTRRTTASATRAWRATT